MSEAPGSAIIEVRGLCSGYHGVMVLKGLDFYAGRGGLRDPRRERRRQDDAPGDACAPLPLMGGAIRFEGEDVSHLPPYETAARGIAYVPQEQGVFPYLTVLENLRVGGMIGSRPRQERMDEVFDLFPDLRNMLKQPARDAQRRRVADGRLRHGRSCRTPGSCCSTSRRPASPRSTSTSS